MSTIYEYVDSLIALGYAPIPGFKQRDGGTIPMPYRDGEIYPSDIVCQSKKTGRDFCPWDTADFIGIRLDRCLLVDYDGNKGRPELTLSQLAFQLGVRSLKPAMVQYGVTKSGEYNGSFHFLFAFDRRLNSDLYYMSQDDKYRGIDFKTGNQLMWIKRGKVQNIPHISKLQYNTPQMLEILRKPPDEVRENSGPVVIKRKGESQERGLMWLERSCEVLAEMHEGGRNKALNSTALAAFRHAMAGEFDEGLAASMLLDAAQRCGLASAEIRDTMKSARSKARRAGPKNLLERPRQNNSGYSRQRG